MKALNVMLTIQNYNSHEGNMNIFHVLISYSKDINWICANNITFRI